MSRGPNRSGPSQQLQKAYFKRLFVRLTHRILDSKEVAHSVAATRMGSANC